MPKRLMCSRCDSKPRLGTKNKWGRMNDLCLDCTVELMNEGTCPSCNNPFDSHSEKCVTRKTVDVPPTVAPEEVPA